MSSRMAAASELSTAALIAMSSPKAEERRYQRTKPQQRADVEAYAV